MNYSLVKLKSLQLPNGGYERFHSMSQTSPITTEHVLRKCMFLGMSKEDDFLNSILKYVADLLHEKAPFPDRVEKVMDWKVATRSMYATWLKIFDYSDHEAKLVIEQWKQILEYATHTKKFDNLHFQNEYNRIFSKPKARERYINVANFYYVNLLRDELSCLASHAYFEYIMENGIYYIYDKNLWNLPSVFDGNETIYYLTAIKMVSYYTQDKSRLHFVKEWVIKNQSSDGYWYTFNVKQDGLILSGNWRIKINKLNDMKHFFDEILIHIS